MRSVGCSVGVQLSWMGALCSAPNLLGVRSWSGSDRDSSHKVGSLRSLGHVRSVSKFRWPGGNAGGMRFFVIAGSNPGGCNSDFSTKSLEHTCVT